MSGRNRTVTFVADWREVLSAYFDSDGLGTPIPQVPRKRGFVGEWAPTDLKDEDVVVEAVYRPAVGRFIQHDGTEVVADLTGPIPEPARVEGCEGRWEPFSLSDGDVVVTARYSGPRHRIRFMVNGFEVTSSDCPAGCFPVLPPVPMKKGCKGRWEPYAPREGTVRVSAVYEPAERVYEVGIGRLERRGPGEGEPALPARDGCLPYWQSRRTASGDYRMTVAYVSPPELHGFPDEPAAEEAGAFVPPDPDKLREAVTDLGFVSEHWSSLEEEEDRPDPRAHTINHADDTGASNGWESLVDALSPLQREYLRACLGSGGTPQSVLRRHGASPLAVETAINAIAQDHIGDPLVKGGEVEQDYASEIREVLKDGS